MMNEEKQIDYSNIDVLKGEFVDSFECWFSANSIVLDSFFAPPPRPKTNKILASRIIFVPQALYALQKVINETIANYEKEIKEKEAKK
jgi:hypothetical protein